MFAPTLITPIHFKCVENVFCTKQYTVFNRREPYGKHQHTQSLVSSDTRPHSARLKVHKQTDTHTHTHTGDTVKTSLAKPDLLSKQDVWLMCFSLFPVPFSHTKTQTRTHIIPKAHMSKLQSL